MRDRLPPRPITCRPMRANPGRSDSLAEFIAVIPARRASTRLPDKALADLLGIPMVVRVASQARASGAERVIVATDDETISAICAEHGIDALMTRADHLSGTERLAEVVEQLALDDECIVVNVQGDEPLMPPALVRRCAEALLAAPHCAIATASHRLTTRTDLLNPNIVKVVTDRAGTALYFSRAPVPFERDASADPAAPPRYAQRHIGLYAYRAAFLKVYSLLEPAPMEQIEKLEQLRALWHGYRIAVFEVEEAPEAGVDTVEDLERVRAILLERSRSPA